MTKKRKKTFKQNVLEAWVLWRCSLSMRRFVSWKAGAFEHIARRYPNTLRAVDATKLATVLVEGFIACLEKEDVEAAENIAKALKERGDYRNIVQERKFSVGIQRRTKETRRLVRSDGEEVEIPSEKIILCDRVMLAVAKRGMQGSTKEHGAYIAYDGLRALKTMGYEISLEVLGAAALLAEARTQNDEFSSEVRAALRDRAQARIASGRTTEGEDKKPFVAASPGQRRFLLRENISPSAS